MRYIRMELCDGCSNDDLEELHGDLRAALDAEQDLSKVEKIDVLARCLLDLLCELRDGVEEEPQYLGAMPVAKKSLDRA